MNGTIYTQQPPRGLHQRHMCLPYVHLLTENLQETNTYIYIYNFLLPIFSHFTHCGAFCGLFRWHRPRLKGSSQYTRVVCVCVFLLDVCQLSKWGSWLDAMSSRRLLAKHMSEQRVGTFYSVLLDSWLLCPSNYWLFCISSDYNQRTNKYIKFICIFKLVFISVHWDNIQTKS